MTLFELVHTALPFLEVLFFVVSMYAIWAAIAPEGPSDDTDR